jgi:hypothetical protein
MKRWLLRLTYPAIVAAFFVSGVRWHHVDDGDPSLRFRHWHDALFVAFVLVLLGMDIGGSIAFAAVNRVLRGEPLAPAWFRRIWTRIRLFLLAFGLVFATGCAALSSLLGAAAPVASAAMGVAEATVRAQAAAAGVSLSDPAVLAAIADARKADEERDAAEAKRIAAIADAVKRLERKPAKPCPSCPVCPTLPQAPAVLPVVDAGAEGGL